MTLKPIYTPENTSPVHNLVFNWTGWFKPPAPAKEKIHTAIEDCREYWQKDGITPENFSSNDSTLQLLTYTRPGISPKLFNQRIKGRLQHALKRAEVNFSFRRKVSFRTVGNNTRDTVERYIERQVGKSDYVDPRYKHFLGQFILNDGSIHLHEAFHGDHGKYWYNIHLVIVVADRRCPVTRNENFQKLIGSCKAIAAKKDYDISHIAVMPDHIHAAVRGTVDKSPETIAMEFLNNLSYVMGYNRCWSGEYYVGTFSEYTRRAIGGEKLT